jgi:RNA polymerase sigma factor (sigma-70 family)
MEREKLQQYRQLCREIEELEEEKQALAEGKLPSCWPLGEISGKGAPGDPTGRTAAMLWDLAVLLADKLNELIALRTEIEQAVDKLPPEERRILRLYYIEGLTWEAVAAEVGYSVRQLGRKQKSIMRKFCPEHEATQGEIA